MNQTNQQSPLGIFCLIPLVLLLLWAVQNQSVALMLIEQPKLILPYLVEQFGVLKLVAGGFTLVFFLSLLAINYGNKHNQNVVRGAKVIPPRRLKAILKRQPRLRNQPQLEIAGMPIPAKLENRGFFMFGSPGSGKTQAIANYQKQLNQEKNGQRKTGHKISTSKFDRLLDNPDNQIKRISKLESQPQKISKPLGKYVSDSYEHLRNLRMKSLFSNESIQGGIA